MYMYLSIYLIDLPYIIYMRTLYMYIYAVFIYAINYTLYVRLCAFICGLPFLHAPEHSVFRVTSGARARTC